MPFAVFRRHQRKLLAIFAILSMFAFVLSDSLPNLLGLRGGAGQDEGRTVVATLYGKPVRLADLVPLRNQRMNANRLIAPITQNPYTFGDISQRSLIDAWILQHEADQLGMPVDKSYAEETLRSIFRGKFTKKQFNSLLASAFSNTMVSGDQVLEDMANELRMQKVTLLPGAYPITPLDVWRKYHDTDEQVSVKAVAFKATYFVKEVREPNEDELKAVYEKGKDLLPDPARATAGFKVPRRIQFQYLVIDGASLANTYREKLTEPEIREYLSQHESELESDLLKPDPDDLPFDVFQGDPSSKLTPRPFRDIKPLLESKISEEKARDEIERRFEAIRREVFEPYAQKYSDVQNQIDDAKERGEKIHIELPPLPDLTATAKKYGMALEQTPKLSREEAEKHGSVCSSETGLVWPSKGKPFVEEFFETSIEIGEPVDLTDNPGKRYLAWKTKDEKAYVPPLDAVRSQVVLAWKIEQARQLAKKAGEQFAEKVRQNQGKFADLVKDKPVITTSPVAKMSRGLYYPGQIEIPSTANDIAEMPNTGDELREAVFSLRPGEAAVAPDQPRNVYYVLTLDKRDMPGFNRLFSPFGPHFQIKEEVLHEAVGERARAWLQSLREKAGLKPDWAPPDEQQKKEEDSTRGRPPGRGFPRPIPRV